MPQLDIYSWVLWSTAILFQLCLVCLLWGSRSYRRWISLFVFLILKCVTSLTLLSITLFVTNLEVRAAWYFYFYWSATAIAHLLEIWVIVQIADWLVGCSESVRRYLRIAVPLFTLVTLIISTLLSFSTPMAPSGRIVTVVIDASRSVTLSILMLFVTVIVLSEVFGIHWQQENLGVAVGMAFSVCGQTVSSWLLAFFPRGRVSDLNALIYAAALVIWLLTFVRGYKPDRLPDLDRVRAAAGSSRVVLERMRPKK